MSNIGEIISGLSASDTLLNGEMWTSDQVQLGQWNSLSVVIYTNSNCTFTSHWSAAGIYYDYTETTLITGGTAIQIPLITIDKWVYFTLLNTGSNQTVLRLNTYGTVTNNAVQVTFPSTQSVTIANQPIGVNVTNSTDLSQNLSIVKLNPYQDSQLNFQNIFRQARSSFAANNPTNSILPYMGWEATDAAISFYATDVYKISLSGFNVSGAGDVGKMSRFYSKSTTPVIPDKTVVVTFATLFIDNNPTSNIYYSDEQVGFGLPYASLDVRWECGFSVGKGPPVAWNGTYTKFRVATWGNGNVSYITQNNFNLDVLNGTGASGMTLNVTALNIYRIRIRYGWTTFVVFSVLNPATGLYVDFHSIITNSSVVPEPILASRLMIDSVNQLSAPGAVGDAGSATASFATYIESGSVIKPGYPISYSVSTSTNTTETLIVVFDNSDNFKSHNSSIVTVLDEISVSSESTASLIIRLYKNTTYTPGVALNYLNSDYSPMEYTNSATFSSSGILVAQYTIGPNGSMSKDVKGIIINPTENLVVRGQLTSGSATNCNYCFRFSHYM